MRTRFARCSTVMLAAAVWLTTAIPAWANSPNPEQYPEAAKRYEQTMERLIWGVLGCTGLVVIVVIIGVVLLIRWIMRRKAAREAAPAQSPPPETP